MTELRHENSAAVNRWQWASLTVGLLSLAACVLGAFSDPAQFFRAYLFSYLFLLGLAIGGLALRMIHHLVGGAWGVMVRRFAEAQMKTLPLLALAFVPLAFGLPYIYLWASDSVATAESQSVQEWYLGPAFFLWRAVAYFAIWLVLVGFLTMWSRRFDATGDVRTAWKLYKLSGPGLVVLGVTLHFAATDWIMSLQTEFTSTIFGPLVFSAQLLSAYALSVILFCCVMSAPQIVDLLSKKVLNDLGGLLLTLLIVWGYLVWFQYMLIWMADLPRGAIWYLARQRGGWNWLAGIILVFGVAIPFLLLLLRAVKQNGALLLPVATAIFVTQLLYAYYLVMPAFGAPALRQHWMDVVMPFGLGGLWTACFLWLLKRRPLLPRHDLNYPHAVHLRELETQEHAREEALSHA